MSCIPAPNPLWGYKPNQFPLLSILSYEDLKSIAVMGGNIKNSTKGSAAALKLMMLTETNVLFLWYENTQQFYRQVQQDAIESQF